LRRSASLKRSGEHLLGKAIVAGDLTGIVWVRHPSLRVMRDIRQNLLLALVYDILGLP
jgi:cation transport ATPase